jgi:hypothetical protein
MIRVARLGVVAIVLIGVLSAASGCRSARRASGPNIAPSSAAPTALILRAVREAASQNRPVSYEGAGGWRVDASPSGPTTLGCRPVQERLYLNGRLVSTRGHKVC